MERILTDNFDVCKISKIIKSVKTLKTGASPTDAWIVSFKNKVMYKDKEIKKAFMKIFLDKNYLNKIKNPSTNLKLAIDGLYYERNVYQNIITPLVDLKICQSFIRYISGGNTCKYDDLFSILEKGKKSKSKSLKSKFNNLINRNLLKYETSNIGLSESNFSDEIEPISLNDTQKLRYEILLTETYEDTHHLSTLLQSSSLQDINLFNIIFQIMIACYSLYLSKTTHNDLHSGNIMVRKLKKPTKILYIVNGQKYLLKISYLVYIYDFDRSYSEKIGKNNVLSIYNEFAQYNEIINNKDIMKLLCSVYKYTQNKIYLQCLSENEKSLKQLIKLFEHDKKCNFQVKKYHPVKKTFYNKFNDIEKIINKFGNFLPEIKDYEDLVESNIFICNKEHFDFNGNINIELYKEYRKKIVNEVSEKPNSKIVLLRKSQKSI